MRRRVATQSGKGVTLTVPISKKYSITVLNAKAKPLFSIYSKTSEIIKQDLAIKMQIISTGNLKNIQNSRVDITKRLDRKHRPINSQRGNAYLLKRT